MYVLMYEVLHREEFSSYIGGIMSVHNQTSPQTYLTFFLYEAGCPCFLA